MPSLRPTGRHFRPHSIPTVVTLLLLALLLGLGFWQLDRAQQKRDLLAAFARRSEAPAVVLSALDPADPDNRYRRVVVRGHYDDAHQILLDNQIHGGRPGYHVYTPLLTAEPRAAILVNRGWVPLGESRAERPSLPVVEAAVTVHGRLAQPANPGIRLGDALADPGWPKVVPYIDYPILGKVLGYPLSPAVVLLDPDAPAGFVRDWHPAFGGFGPQRHVGYAVQWFALAITLVVIYVIVNLRHLPPERK